MASRTQLRVLQLTGSVMDIVYSGSQTSAAASTAVAETHLGGLLGQIAGAIGRISGKSGEGASAFTNQAAGVFSHDTVKLGGDGDELEIRESGGDLTFDVTTADKDIVFTHNTTATGDNTEIFRIDGSAESILMASGKKIELGGTSTTIAGDNTDVTIEGTNLNIAAGIDIASQDTTITLRDNRATALSFDAAGQSGILKIDTQDNVEKVVAHALDVTNNLSVGGNLTVTGDIDYQYVTSSIVEFNDPMLVLNAIDTSSNTGLLASASFHSAGAHLEGDANNPFDYGVIFKRAVNYSAAAGAGIDTPGSLRDDYSEFGTQDIGVPFGLFKITGKEQEEGQGNINIQRGMKRALILDTASDSSTKNRSGVKLSDLLNAHRGAFCVLSSSNVANSSVKLFGLITSGANDRVEVQFLGNGESYGGVAQPNDQFDAAAFNAGKASLQILSAYGGSIFDKDSGTMHIAAAAITGSGDNNFLSSSANILLHGAVAASEYGIQLNDLVSGSQDIGTIDIDFQDGASELRFRTKNDGDNVIIKTNNTNGARLDLFDTEVSAYLYAHGGTGRIQIGASQDETKVAHTTYLSASNGIKFRVNNGTEFALPQNDGTTGHFLKTDGSGNLSFGSSSSNISKCIRILSASVSAGDQFELSSTDDTVGGQISGLSTAESQGASLEVYVNGQLLISGSNGEITANPPTRDFEISAVDKLKFAFDLEDGDIVQVIKR